MRTVVVSALLAVLLVPGTVVLRATPAAAHWADLAVAEVVVEGSEARMTLTLPTGLLRRADDDRDGILSPAEVGRHAAALRAVLAEHVRLATRGEPGRLVAVEHAPAPPAAGLPGGSTHTTLVLRYAWPAAVAGLVVRYDLFLPGVSTASCLVTVVQAGRVHSLVLTPARREAVLDARPLWQQARSFVLLGVEHILTGYDHLLFLLGLLLLGGSLRGLVKTVTAFTVAHSVTLALAVLDLVVLPARLVESAIALSVAYVAGENLWRRERALPGRWRLTFAFGLVHGLGFASILREVGLGASLPLSVGAFNLGVEAGQLAVVAPLVLALRVLAGRAWAQPVRLGLSGGVAAAGVLWFVRRAVLG